MLYIKFNLYLVRRILTTLCCVKLGEVHPAVNVPFDKVEELSEESAAVVVECKGGSEKVRILINLLLLNDGVL